MELHEYPRPANDTGIGVHWSTGYASAVGIRKIREFWLPELKALGVKWVKIFNHDGALDFAELLLAEGMMPILRLYRPTPNPSRLDVKDVVNVDAFLRIGVRYFEFNSEPDRDSEWKGGRMPANAINLVVENSIANMEIILERGGMPGVPAVSNGSRWDLVGKIVALGRKDLFQGPVWQAVHNYARNRPLDYPYDIGNQEGAAYTLRFYQVVGDEPWGDNAWRGRSLDEVNRLRRDRSNPGATVMDDAACWLAYEYFDALNRQHLGRSLPILSTENGYLIGEDIDARYPATTPDLHMAQSLEACRVMMGTSQRFPPAPEYYFCTGFWLLGNIQLGSTSNWWENHAWYSERWPGGALPIVFALKTEPKVARLLQGNAVEELLTLHGTVAHAGQSRTLVLEKNGIERARVTLDANSRYTMTDLPPGSYLLRIPGTGIEQAVVLSAGQSELMVDFDLGAPAEIISRSQIRGAVRGGSGAVLMLVRAEDGQEWVTMARDDGSFRFIDLPPGLYSLRVNPQGSRIDAIKLDGVNQREVELAVAGWGYTIRAAPDNSRVGSIFCIVKGQRGVPVQVHAGDWSSERIYTTRMAELGEYGCEIGPLDPGHYIVAVDIKDENSKPIQLEARVLVDRRRTPLVEFIYTDMNAPFVAERSQIVGRVIGDLPADSKTSVCLVDQQGKRQEQPVGANGEFSFEYLSPGVYAVEVVGWEQFASRSDIALDGGNQVEIELRIPRTPGERVETSPQSQGVITGVAPQAGGQLARLVDAVGNEYRQFVNSENRFAFEKLAAGVYALTIEGGYTQANLEIDGINGLEVIFSELSTIWEAEVTTAGSMPGYSVVRVEVEDRAGLPVHIWKEDWEGMARRTGSKPEYGPYVLEFSPLGPGHYMVEPQGLGIHTDVELTGLEAVWIHFRQRTLPLAPTELRPFAIMPPGTTPADAARSTGTPDKHYLYLVDNPRNPEDLLALLRYVSRTHPQVGKDWQEALNANRVTLIGNPENAAEIAELASRLAIRGIRAAQLVQNVAAALDKE